MAHATDSPLSADPYSDWKRRNNQWRIEKEPVRDEWIRRDQKQGGLTDVGIAERDSQLEAIDVKYGMTNPKKKESETPAELVAEFLEWIRLVRVSREWR